MPDKAKTIVLRGKLDWAKVLGNARKHTGNPKYDKGPYWSVDLTPDAKTHTLMKQFGITKKLKEPSGEKDERTETFLSLKVLENKADGGKNQPPKIVDAANKPWPENKLLGNGTIGDVKVRVVDYGSGSEMGVYLQAIRVLEHVAYEIDEFEPLDEDDQYFAEGSDEEDAVETVSVGHSQDSEAGTPEDLDDDVPY